MADLNEEEQGVRNAIQSAIDSALQAYGGFPLNWSVILEGVEKDGTKSVWLLANDAAKSWDTLGLLNYALALEQAAINVHVMKDHGIDGE
jgi:hypothetical protein